jgi:hypothetical protein
MIPNITQNTPATKGNGMDAKIPPNFPAKASKGTPLQL